MKKITFIKDNFEEIICGLLLGIMLLILTYQVVLRFIFNSSNAWSEELARYLFIWFIFIGASYAAQKTAHIKRCTFKYIS
jgi:TRAP-type C4-dicarboxylate transport system permease small subunit